MLVERAAELAGLRRTVQQVTCGGSGSLVLIGGRPGCGRSALLHRLRSEAAEAGALVLRADGAASERAFRFGLARRLLHGLSEVAGPPRDEGPPAPAAAESAPEDDSTVPVPVLHSLHALLLRTSAEQAVVLTVDDLHHADEASLRCLAYLVARLRGMRVLIGAVLDEDAERSAPLREIARAADHRLRPGPLSAAGSARVVRAAGEFAAACHELTGGVPRDLHALLAKAVEAGLPADAAAVPELRELAAAEDRRRLVRALSAGAATAPVARAVVVLGEHAEPGLVQRLSGVDPAGCEQALRALRPWFEVRPDRIAAAGPEVVAAVEEAMPAAESNRLHLRAAVLLHADGHPAEPVADQLLPVGGALPGWGVHRLRDAAAAVRPRDPRTAAGYLRRALLDLDPGGAARARLLAELGAVELAFDTSSAVRHLAQAAPRLPELRERAEVAARLPLISVAGAPVAAELVGRLRERFDPRADPELALRLEARARCAALQDPSAHAAAEDRLAELAAGGGAPSAAERELRAVLLAALALSGRGRAEQVAALTRELLEHEPAGVCTSPHSLLGFVPSLLLAAGAPEGLESWLELAAGHARRQGARGTEALVLAERGLLESDTGRQAQARRTALAALDLAGRDRPGELVPAVHALAEVARRLRDEELAEPLLRLPGQDSDLRVFAAQRLVQCGLALGRADLPAALAHVLDCGRRLEQAGWYGPALFPWRSSAVQLHQRLGDRAAAGELAEEDAERSRRWGAPVPLGRALRIQGGVVGGSRGVALLRESVQVLRAAADPLELSRALIALGAALAERDPAESGRLAAEGRRIAARCGAAAFAEAGSAPVPAAAERAPVAAGLTRGERAVAELAALGRTNQDIADRLRVSRRAVEKHLTAAYRKLGVGGRAELAAVLPARIPED